MAKKKKTGEICVCGHDFLVHEIATTHEKEEDITDHCNECCFDDKAICNHNFETSFALEISKIREDEANESEAKAKTWEWYDEDTDRWFPIEEVETPAGLLPARILPFKPSNDQLIRYMKFKKHPVPWKKVKDERKTVETGAQKELVKVFKKTKDPLYKAVLEYRGCETAISRYVDKWKPGEDGRVHSEFMYVPASGQLNSVNPNAQNFIKHGSKEGADRKYAEGLRGMIVAPTGYSLVELDFQAYHGVTTGFEARDKDYMRLARLDMHSFVTAHFVYIQKLIKSSELPDLSWSDKDLQECLAGFKKRFPEIRDVQAKPAGLGYGFGMGPNKLHAQNEDTIPLRNARILMKLLDDLFPVAKTWRGDIKFLADRQGYLVSKFGFVRWFWDVFSRKVVDGKWVVSNGSDAEDAIAFLPSNDGHGHMQTTMVALEKMGANEEFGLINMIHDSLLYLMEDSKLGKGINIIQGEMSKPSVILVDPLMAPKGLSFGVDVKVGKSWDKMEKFKG